MGDIPYDIIADNLKNGDVIPFFGAAASAIYRPDGESWEPGKPFTPFGYELAATFARAARYPMSQDRPADLALVASYTEHVQGNRPYINRKLHQYFSVEYEPGLLHNKLAQIGAAKLYLTTNYDDLIEKALVAAGRKPHLVVDRGTGLLVHRAGEDPRPVSLVGNDLHKYLHDPETNEPSGPIVFKLHGSVDKSKRGQDAYLITEEDYVDFLGRNGDSHILPPYLVGLMPGKSFLFLGYSLGDWNVRVILRKILSEDRDRRIWAIVSGHSAAEQELWQSRNLKIYPTHLREFAHELAKYL
jgi:SIR2-like domain